MPLSPWRTRLEGARLQVIGRAGSGRCEICAIASMRRERPVEMPAARIARDERSDRTGVFGIVTFNDIQVDKRPSPWSMLKVKSAPA